MDVTDKQKEGYITLKEAASISGYSPDYVGQLIRKGRIEGKQVYANVAWMTTRGALEEYLASERARGKSASADPLPIYERALALCARDEGSRAVRFILTAIASAAVLALLVEFYILSVSIDRRLSARAEGPSPETVFAASVLADKEVEHVGF